MKVYEVYVVSYSACVEEKWDHSYHYHFFDKALAEKQQTDLQGFLNIKYNNSPDYQARMDEWEVFGSALPLDKILSLIENYESAMHLTKLNHWENVDEVWKDAAAGREYTLLEVVVENLKELMKL